MRVSIVNPTTKKKAKKAKKSPAKSKGKPWEKGLRAARKARKAKAGSKAKKAKAAPKKKRRKAAKKAKATAPKKRRKSKAKKARTTAPKKRRKAAKKSRKTTKRKPAKRKKAKVSRKGKRKASKKSKKKSRKVIHKSLGKRTRPVMYQKGKKVSHSPASKFARKGFRFNPSMKKHVVKIGNMRMLRKDIGDAPVTHIVGMVGGFLASGYVGGYVGKLAQDQFKNDLLGDAGSIVGNLIGTEVPAMAVHYILPKVGLNKYAVPVARGMRVGGYVALGLNVFTLALKAFNVPVPYRILGAKPSTKEFVLSGLGDVDLITAGISGLGANTFANTAQYAALDNESAGLVDEISALSAYVGDQDEFGLSSLASERAGGSISDL